MQKAAELAQLEPVESWSEFNTFHFVNRFFGTARGGRLLGFQVESDRHAGLPCHAVSRPSYDDSHA